MQLPRWTAYVALAVLAVFIVSAIPRPHSRPSEGAAEAVRAGTPTETTWPRVVVLGIDGMDPEILAGVIERHPDRTPNFQKLIAQGQGIRELGTSTPPQSPVAWSNFITGRNPGGHGIFDFIHRDLEGYAPLPGTVTKVTAGSYWMPGKWQFPTQEGGNSNRSGRAFWTILGENGVPADVWRMPINFPVEPSKEGWSFPGMMTPAVDSAYGQPTLYSTNPPASAFGKKKVIQVVVSDGVVSNALSGPANAFIEGSKTHNEQIPLKVYVNEEVGAAVVEIEGSNVVLEPGEWSEFVPVTFSLLPLGLMDQAGIVRFYLRSVTPEFEMYASPVNVDPTKPINPVSFPESAAQELAEEIGLYYTQGMAEDVNGLKNRMLTDAEFMQQALLVYLERGRMLDVALERYAQKPEGGFLFFYYSSVDLCCHMMWRHLETNHPAFDPEVAGEDSTWWSGRPGTTWQDVVDDLYLRMDPVLGKIREAVGEETLVIVMSDHGFASYQRKFDLNAWLVEHGYLVLREGAEARRESSRKLHIYDHFDPEARAGERPDRERMISVVDWSKSRAYGMGFNGLYLNLAGRESQGCVDTADAPALLAQIKAELEAERDPERDGAVVILSADLAKEVYEGERLQDAPDILVGYNRGYGNSDEASQGEIGNEVLSDNTGGTFSGHHLMDPSVVPGMILTNGTLSADDPRLEDMPVEILRQYGIQPDESMIGHPVLDGPYYE